LIADSSIRKDFGTVLDLPFSLWRDISGQLPTSLNL
jgi:hypothetical protein